MQNSDMGRIQDFMNERCQIQYFRNEGIWQIVCVFFCVFFFWGGDPI